MMELNEIERELIDMATMSFNLTKPLTREMRLTEAGVDSLEMIEVALLVEDRFDLREFELDEDLTVAELAEKVQNAL